MTLTIKCPDIEHIDQLIYLNNKYNIDNIPEDKIQSGFIRIHYNYEHFKRLIEYQEIVAAIDNNNIAGYYLVGKKTQNGDLGYQIDKARKISNLHNINFERIGYGCQVCIEEQYRSKNLFAEMLAVLKYMVQNKYDILLCSISQYNTISLKAHQKQNWIFYENNEATNFFYLPINEQFNELKSNIKL